MWAPINSKYPCQTQVHFPIEVIISCMVLLKQYLSMTLKGHVALSWTFFPKFWIIFINSNMIYSISNPFYYLEYLYPAQVPLFF